MSVAPSVLRPLDYELPHAPKIAVESWSSRLQAVALVTVLFCGVQAQLISGFPPDTGTAADVALRFFGYSGLLLNLGGTLSAVLLLIAITSVPVVARHLYMHCAHSYPRKLFEVAENNRHFAPNPNASTVTLPTIAREISEALFTDGDAKLLRAFGVARGWDILLLHCIFCFTTGCVCAFLQIALSLWIGSRTVVAAVIMPATFVAVVPPLLVFFRLMGGHPCPECDEEKKAKRDGNIDRMA